MEKIKILWASSFDPTVGIKEQLEERGYDAKFEVVEGTLDSVFDEQRGRVDLGSGVEMLVVGDKYEIPQEHFDIVVCQRNHDNDARYASLGKAVEHELTTARHGDYVVYGDCRHGKAKMAAWEKGATHVVASELIDYVVADILEDIKEGKQEYLGKDAAKCTDYMNLAAIAIRNGDNKRAARFLHRVEYATRDRVKKESPDSEGSIYRHDMSHIIRAAWGMGDKEMLLDFHRRFLESMEKDPQGSSYIQRIVSHYEAFGAELGITAEELGIQEYIQEKKAEDMSGFKL